MLHSKLIFYLLQDGYKWKVHLSTAKVRGAGAEAPPASAAEAAVPGLREELLFEQRRAGSSFEGFCR